MLKKIFTLTELIERTRKTPLIFLALLLIASFAIAQDGIKLRLETLDLSTMQQGFGKPQINRSIDKNPLKIGGIQFENGVGTHSFSRYKIDLKGAAIAFTAQVGLDDEATTAPGSINFRVYGDKKMLYESGMLKGKNLPRDVFVDLKGVKILDLVVTDANDGIDFDHADWADAVIIMDKNKPDVKPSPIPYPEEQKVIWTPKEKDSPSINAPKIIGAGAERDFMYYIPISGKRPLKAKVEGLPGGLKYNPDTNIINGITGKKAEYKLTVSVENKFGKDRKDIQLIIGDGIAKTPPMGWNSWNCWGCSVDEEKMKAAADAMVESGLINYGWTYINIDDCWQGERDAATKKINSNPKFPNMKNLADYIHSKGLKFGVYTDMGTKTCAGYEGTKDHEIIDAKTYAEWGVDYVKCDWCYSDGMVSVEAYKKMGDAIKECGRDILFSICNWGVDEPWKWGASVGGNMWRTTGDIVDLYGHVYEIMKKQAELAEYAQPGHWNDPDMLVVGKVGWGPKLRDSRLSPNEQYSHISMWSLLAAPLILGCDMKQLDDWTKSLLTNTEVLAVNQDVLGKQAKRLIKNDKMEIWVKELADNSVAIGIFNITLSDLEAEDIEYSLNFSDIKISPKQKIRDIWRQKDIGNFTDKFDCKVPEHGVVFIKAEPVK